VLAATASMVAARQPGGQCVGRGGALVEAVECGGAMFRALKTLLNNVLVNAWQYIFLTH
jgi:hypothetical protein